VRVNTNIPALISYNALNQSSRALQKSIERLSTGLRINGAADDAAGLAISEKMRAQFRGLGQAVSNAQDGINMIQTADGALDETQSILRRMRELSVQAANDVLTQEDRGFIQLEIDELRQEITRISTTTQFNKKQLLDGSAAALWSTGDLYSKAIIRGGLREIDAFGQKVVNEGNYKIEVGFGSGKSHVLKAGIFSIKHSISHADGTTQLVVGDPAGTGTSLIDIDRFWDANGKFLLADPKTLTITQGDGRTASITLYSTDKVSDLINKLNTAIGSETSGLGQDKYNTASGPYAQYVAAAGGTGFLSTPGTIVLRSAVSGDAGTLSFSGDEDIVKALGINQLQAAVENTFSVTVSNAHGATPPARTTGITGNVLYGFVRPNVDFSFNPMDFIAVATVADGSFSFTAKTNPADLYLHLADNTTVFQIGANEGEDMGAYIGDMSARALGLNRVIVTDRESAARSISVLDTALNRVSSQRARLGAYQNRLEHTVNNLTTSSQNMQSSESRIRDTDMAKEMMEFTRLNILSQAGTAMLAQANQLPSNILSLLR
jgi:flagellin-like hook-associated protein FlgL